MRCAGMFRPGVRPARMTAAAMTTGFCPTMAALQAPAVASAGALRTATVAVAPTAAAVPTPATAASTTPAASLTVCRSEVDRQDMRPAQSKRRDDKRTACRQSVR